MDSKINSDKDKLIEKLKTDLINAQKKMEEIKRVYYLHERQAMYIGNVKRKIKTIKEEISRLEKTT